MTEKKMKDCGGSTSTKVDDVVDPIEADYEKVARIDMVAIHPDEVEYLMKFGNQRVRNKVQQFSRQLGIDLF